MRLFVAVGPPDDAVDHLETFLEPRRQAADFRWSPSDQWHVTLAFAPDVEEWRVDDLLEHVAGAAAGPSPAALRLAGCVAFPDPFGTRVLAVGLDDEQGLLPRLSQRVRGAANRCGVEVDGQRFRPHLTVARMRRPTGTTSWVRLLDDYAGPAWTAHEVHVVASHLGEGPRGRPRHEVLASVSVGGS